MNRTTMNPENPAEAAKPSARRIFRVFLAVLVILFSLLHWGGRHLVASDPLPAHVDAAIVLQGSITGEKARIAGAVPLLRQNIASRMLVSIPKESYWGQPVADAARHYLDTNYGGEISSRADFCELNADVNSTEQEARALASCIHNHGWETIAVVTSDYHTRRAGMIWKSMLKKQSSPLRVWIHGVPDPEFQPDRWWRNRLYAKTWFYEFTKLLWTCIFGPGTSAA